MKLISLIAAVILLAAQVVPALAADGLPGAPVRSESGKSRQEQWCKDNAEKCREIQARREQFCKSNPEKCKEMQARREQCKADPEKCRAEMQAQFEQRFKSADADNDGRLTREEAQKGMPMVARHFDQIDANKDGLVTREELQAARKARAGTRKGPGSSVQPDKVV